ncbi:Protein of unknown function [Ekhidna lutea]|uniref:DUF1579 domain-containing protein n=1 Tax=Ekhidna lutea TaxID=447679 RepID=A0A239MAB2_EKHLU|nr:DUF1579 family protein [Ekhidna lutea]SNT39686.1 Protein of unknown function [Ekhidna lutea]
MRATISVLSFFIATHLCIAQENFTPPCLQPEHDNIKYLSGQWKVTSRKLKDVKNDEWEESSAIAIWERQLKGCLWTEHWEGIIDECPLKWVQHLTFDNRNKQWQQAMIDSAHGNIITTNGFYQNNELVFSLAQHRKGNLLIDKTIFQFISENLFEWEVQSSFDGGQSWTTFWTMKYERIK